ncbi:hypothetical protein [Streptomyces niveus]|uniref:hypothetical protein n=1 Tax=Streptomyces niveus TaxID=193462 RepID=UPI00341B9CC0
MAGDPVGNVLEVGVGERGQPAARGDLDGELGGRLAAHLARLAAASRLRLGDAISMVKAERGPTALAAGGFVLAEWRPSLPQPRGCLSSADSVGFAARRSG